jgi:predicted DNA-binding protein (MmcQ/YjbR family)
MRDHSLMAAKKTQRDTTIAKRLREMALAKYPGTHLKSPWPGHMDLAVNDKTYAYLSLDGEPFSISCKLPSSNALALQLPHTEPAAYGLGKSGWVAAKFPDQDPPMDMLESWLDESYRAQAPKKLVAQLDGGAAPKPAKNPAKKAAPKKKR